MSRIPVIAILDFGKTNKKLLLFNESYKLVYEESTVVLEISDEDGDPCEDLSALMDLAKKYFTSVYEHPAFLVKALNFSVYGASWVMIDENNEALFPLYNYLKPFPEDMSRDFFIKHGNQLSICTRTCSPFLGSLNSGLQLYRYKKTNPAKWAAIKYALHLPQFWSWFFTGKPFTDLTSIGCHTLLWNFGTQAYDDWVINERLEEKFPPIEKARNKTEPYKNIQVGIGLHDSSAALIPYLMSFSGKFLLLSTGTWNISLNPFAVNRLTEYDLKMDCLEYLDIDGKPVRASRLFAGYYHDKIVRHLNKKFDKPDSYFKSVALNQELIAELKQKILPATFTAENLQKFDPDSFDDFETAYHALMIALVRDQTFSIQLVLQQQRFHNIYVDGGFSRNKLFMNLLTAELQPMHVFAASVPQASALGAALAIHNTWNTMSVPENLVSLQSYHKVSIDH